MCSAFEVLLAVICFGLLVFSSLVAAGVCAGSAAVRLGGAGGLCCCEVRFGVVSATGSCAATHSGLVCVGLGCHSGCCCWFLFDSSKVLGADSQLMLLFLAGAVLVYR
jgi:hypothetical protein